MADSPIAALSRVLGGVVLMQGNLGHQVLGQLLIMNTNEVAIAAAGAVVAATTRTPNAGVQVALRTVAPALAVRALFQKQERRIEQREVAVAERERTVEEQDDDIAARERELDERLQLERAAGGVRAGSPRPSAVKTRKASSKKTLPAAGTPSGRKKTPRGLKKKSSKKR